MLYVNQYGGTEDVPLSKREGTFGFVCLFVFVCVKIVMNFEMFEKYVVIQGANNGQ
jgi:hypothetical protein